MKLIKLIRLQLDYIQIIIVIIIEIYGSLDAPGSIATLSSLCVLLLASAAQNVQRTVLECVG